MGFIYYSKNDFQYKGQRIPSTRDTDPIDLPKESPREQASYKQNDSRDIDIRGWE